MPDALHDRVRILGRSPLSAITYAEDDSIKVAEDAFHYDNNDDGTDEVPHFHYHVSLLAVEPHPGSVIEEAYFFGPFHVWFAQVSYTDEDIDSPVYAEMRWHPDTRTYTTSIHGPEHLMDASADAIKRAQRGIALARLRISRLGRPPGSTKLRGYDRIAFIQAFAKYKEELERETDISGMEDDAKATHEGFAAYLHVAPNTLRSALEPLGLPWPLPEED